MSRRSKLPRREIDYEYELRDRRLRTLGFTDGDHGYAEYLRSPEWDRAREQLSRREPELCFVCWQSGCQAHHCTYRNLGRERIDELVWLCDHHHKAVHTLAEVFDRRLAAAHVIERHHYFRNRMAERAGELRARTQAAVDAGRFAPAAGALGPGLVFKVDADARRIRLIFRTVNRDDVRVAITFPNGVEDRRWDLRPDPSFVPPKAETGESSRRA